MSARQWIKVFEREDPYGQGTVGAALDLDPAYRFHNIEVHVEADVANAANVRLKIQEAENATGPWVDRYVHPTDLRPGGFVDFGTYVVRRYVRMLAYSVGGGTIRVQINDPEPQVLPQYLKDDLSCTTWCECDCETGTETTDEAPSS